jgi:hypothetical protein
MHRKEAVNVILQICALRISSDTKPVKEIEVTYYVMLKITAKQIALAVIIWLTAQTALLSMRRTFAMCIHLLTDPGVALVWTIKLADNHATALKIQFLLVAHSLCCFFLATSLSVCICFRSTVLISADVSYVGGA